MSLVNTTAALEEAHPNLLRAIRGAIADENGAANLYDMILELSSLPSFVREAITEIRDDELQHAAKLYNLVVMLDPNSETQYAKGTNGS